MTTNFATEWNEIAELEKMKAEVESTIGKISEKLDLIEKERKKIANKIILATDGFTIQTLNEKLNMLNNLRTEGRKERGILRGRLTRANKSLNKLVNVTWEEDTNALFDFSDDFSPTRRRKPKSKSRRKPTSKSKSRKHKSKSKSRKHKPKSKSRKHKPKSKSRKPKSRSRRRR
jgi:hypothetical protein